MKRPKIGIVLDYSLRIPDFKESYLKFKEQILVGITAGAGLEVDNVVEENNYWTKAIKEDPTITEFYIKIPIPEFNQDFDITLKKYFMTPEHRLKFLEEWSYNLYGQGAVTNKADITIINTAQSKLCDVVLIDRCTNTRKVANTFAFLSRAGLFVKEVVFINTIDELEETKKELIDCWDPFTNKEQVISLTDKINNPTQSFLDWFMEVEQQIKKGEEK